MRSSKKCPPFRSIRAGTVKLDARGISVKMQLDRTGIDPSVNCTLDSLQMKYDPIRIRFNHFDEQTAKRKLLWHENELQTTVRK